MAGALFLGIFLPPSAPADPLELALEMASLGDWVLARREALRVVHQHPQDERALLLAVEASLALNFEEGEALKMAEHLAHHAAEPPVRGRARWLAGRSLWAMNRRKEAWNHFAALFKETEDSSLFLRSGCALFLLLREERKLADNDPGLVSQLATLRDKWTFELREEVRPPRRGKNRRHTPASWIVDFYRSQISPAIGHRCSLEPSCSEYFLQASLRHGWLAVPLIGDRLVREPGVVRAAEQPVNRNGLLRYRDPVEAHTFWLTR